MAHKRKLLHANETQLPPKKRQVTETESSSAKQAARCQNLELQLLCFGYCRQYFKNTNINCNPCDISSIIYKYLFIDWKWDYFYNENENSKPNENHQITNDYKTFECNRHRCFAGCFVRCNTPMKANCGIYKIEIKINQMNDENALNCIGITTNCDKYNNTNHYIKDHWYDSNDYIAWTADKKWDKDFMKHRLLCGIYGKQSSNIFYKHGFKYESNNQFNIDSLPDINVNDILIMSYDSNRNELTFMKKNDATCHCTIKNLPKNVTCYWFVGHGYHKMNVTIL